MNMLNPFVCGTFHQEYDEPCLASPNSSPRKPKRKDSKNNPYSTRGLDKFSELLADLDEKRQKIYSQMNPHDISFVRFVYSNTNDDVVPVVVKVKNNTNNKDQRHSKSQELKVVRAATTTDQNQERKQPKTMETHNSKVAYKKKNNAFWDVGKPSFYLPVVMVLVLFLLVVFGRSVTTLCTCVLWYAMSFLKDDDTRMMPVKKKIVINEGAKKKEYLRGWSEKKMVVVSEERIKKKDYVRRWSEKKMTTDGLLSPRSGD